MPRLLTPLATLPLYAVVKPTIAATAILQPIIQSTPTKQVSESVNSECAEINTESNEVSQKWLKMSTKC